jgi:hypothetical protein
MEGLATEKQKNYANSLGVEFLPGVSKAEISALISDAVDSGVSRGGHADQSLKDYADALNLEYSEDVSSRLLKIRVLDHLHLTENDEQLCRWFAFRVARDRELKYGGKTYSLIDERIGRIAGRLFTDKRILKSIKRYGHDSLNFFGNHTAFDGSVYEGGSRGTVAYKLTVVAFEESESVPEIKIQDPAPRVAVKPVPSEDKVDVKPEVRVIKKVEPMSELRLWGWFAFIAAVAWGVLVVVKA